MVTTIDPSSRNRSRVSNGKKLFVDLSVDGRSAEARRFRDVFAEIVSDLGGARDLSEGQRQLARRAALISVHCEILEGKSVAGETIDVEQFGRLTDRLGRAFDRLGLERRARDVASSPLADYFARPLAEATE